MADDLFKSYYLPDLPSSISNLQTDGGVTVLKEGQIQSPNFTKGKDGWRIDSEGNADFQGVNVNGVPVRTQGTFGGDGSDGDLIITQGAININLGAAATVVKNYSSISITGTGSLTFSNPHAKGTLIILKSQGNVTLTSSTTPNIDASGMGGAGGTSGAVGADGGDGNDPNALLSGTVFGAKGTAAGAGGAAGVALTLLPYYAKTNIFNKNVYIIPGAGGGGGGGGPVGNTNSGGAGGNGGGALRIECGGAWNFTTTSGISVAGKDGAAGGNSGTTHRGGGGGGGGAGGMCVVLYKTLTANTGTINTAGGTGGIGGKSTGGDANDGAGGGGGGAGAYGGAGGNGGGNNSSGSTTTNTSAGGGGGGGSNTGGTTGGSGGATDNVLFVQNTEF